MPTHGSPPRPARPALASMGAAFCNSPPRSPSHGLGQLSLGSPLKKQQRSYSSGSKSRSASPTKGSRSARGSPVKASSTESVRTPHRARTKDDIANGGLGRDMVGGRAQWDAPSGASPKRKKSTGALNKHYDRFIPTRDSSNAASSLAAGHCDSNPPTLDLTGNMTSEHTQELSQSLGIELGKRILSFSSEPPPSASEPSALLAAYAKTPKKGGAAQPAAQRRRIPTMPTRVLDAPGLIDDYYLNLLDWSCTNLVAIGLDNQVYVWNAETGAVSSLCTVTNPNAGAAAADDEGDEYVCSLRFAEDGSYLAVGTSSGPIQIYDVTTAQRTRTMAGHPSRVAALGWSGAVLSSGGKEGGIWNSDVRIAQHKVSEMRGHRAEVCGLEWRLDGAGGLSGGGQGLLASGGNDNVVNVWDGRNPNAPKMTKNNHTAAVKALAWSPWQSSLLATGGGSNDKTIHFWQTTTGARLNSLTTGSQVTSLAFNPHARELVSAHGYPDHHLSVWAYPGLTKVADINNAHETRILHTALGPDGCTLATASSDENLKFWTIFAAPGRGKGGPGTSRASEKEDGEAIQRKRAAIR